MHSMSIYVAFILMILVIVVCAILEAEVRKRERQNKESKDEERKPTFKIQRKSDTLGAPGSDRGKYGG